MKNLGAILIFVGFILIAGAAGSSDLGASLREFTPFAIKGLALLATGGFIVNVCEN